MQSLPLRPGVIAQVRASPSETRPANSHRGGGVINGAPRSSGLSDLPLLSPQQAWSGQGQQLLVPAAWQQMTSMAPPPPPLANDAPNGQQRLSDWG